MLSMLPRACIWHCFTVFSYNTCKRNNPLCYSRYVRMLSVTEYLGTTSYRWPVKTGTSSVWKWGCERSISICWNQCKYMTVILPILADIFSRHPRTIYLLDLDIVPTVFRLETQDSLPCKLALADIAREARDLADAN